MRIAPHFRRRRVSPSNEPPIDKSGVAPVPCQCQSSAYLGLSLPGQRGLCGWTVDWKMERRKRGGPSQACEQAAADPCRMDGCPSPCCCVVHRVLNGGRLRRRSSADPADGADHPHHSLRGARPAGWSTRTAMTRRAFAAGRSRMADKKLGHALRGDTQGRFEPT